MQEQPGRPTSTAAPRYEEHVNASVILWIFVAILSVSVGLAYGAAIGYGWGFLAFLVIQGLGSWWLLSARSRIAVDDDVLIVGRARLPVEFVGSVIALDSEEARYAAGPGADARAYLQLRGTGAPAVKVVLNDPADPTPYWLVSTQHPRELRDAIEAARDAKARREA